MENLKTELLEFMTWYRGQHSAVDIEGSEQYAKDWVSDYEGSFPDKFAVKRTSKEWEALVPKKYKLRIMDPDGWDRSGDFDYSFNKEKIIKNEFDRRLSVSTISVNVVFFMEDWETGEKIC